MLDAAGSEQVEKAFLDDILSKPDDDAPRLIYADWLEDRDGGDGKLAARAEFIRTQVELARMGEDDPRREGMREREHELFRRHGQDWKNEVFGGAQRAMEIRTSIFRRGFIDGVELPAAVFLYSAGRLFDLAPTIREARIRECSSDDALSIAKSPYLARLTLLDLTNNHIGNDAVKALAGSTHQPSSPLRQTAAGAGGGGLGGAAALLTGPHRPQRQETLSTNSGGKCRGEGGRFCYRPATATPLFLPAPVAFSAKGAPSELQAGLNILRNPDPKNPGGENVSPTGFVTGGHGSPGLPLLAMGGRARGVRGGGRPGAEGRGAGLAAGRPHRED